MKLVEVCFPDGAAGAREAALAWCAALGKTAVEVPDLAGFVVNRLLFPYLFDAVRFMEQTGMEAGEIDTCMKLGAGHPMGPLALLDFVGLDVCKAIGDALYAASNEEYQKPPKLLVEMADAGQAGAQVRCGFLQLRLRAAARPSSSRTQGAWRALARERPRTPKCAGLVAALTGEVPDHVCGRDALLAGLGLDLFPGKLRLGKLVPAGQVECLDRAFERRAEVLLRTQQGPSGLQAACRSIAQPTCDTSRFEWGTRVARRS